MSSCLETTGSDDSMVKEFGKILGMELSPFKTFCISLSTVTMVFLSVLGCISTFGLLSSSVAGWTTVGCAAVLVLANLGSGGLEQKKWFLIALSVAALGLIATGTLGGLGYISAFWVGMSISVIPSLVAVGACGIGGLWLYKQLSY